MTDLPQLGLELARLRKAAGLTQKQLATQVGMGQSTLARFETGGVAEFGSRKLLRLLEVLGFGLEYAAARKEFTLDDALNERLTASSRETAEVARNPRNPS